MGSEIKKQELTIRGIREGEEATVQEVFYAACENEDGSDIYNPPGSFSCMAVSVGNKYSPMGLVIGVASGIYFYRLTTEDFAESGKMVRMK